MEKDNTKGLSNVIRIDDERIQDHLGKIVRGLVEDTLNSLLEAEAERLVGAGRYERTEARRDIRSGSYERKLQTRAGEVSLKVPKLRRQTFEEALIEMYLAGVSVRHVEDITEALWGTRVSPGTVSNLNKKIYAQIEAWRNRPIEGKHPYLYLDGIVLKRSWAGEVRNVSLLVAIGVNDDGYREILGIVEGAKEDKKGWSAFLKHLKTRGLKGVELVISDACKGLVESVAEVYSEARWQRCAVHWYRSAFSHAPSTKMREVALMLKAIHDHENREAAQVKARELAGKLKAMKLAKVAEWLNETIDETVVYCAFPDEHWRRIRTNTPLERVMREIRRRTRVVGAFPDGQSALNLAAARLRHIVGTKWSHKRYMNMQLLRQKEMIA